MELLATSKNGIEVFFDQYNSHTATHFADAPHLRALAHEVITQTVLTGEAMFFDRDMGRIVGDTDLVENEEGDEIVFAKRRNRDVYTSFNKSKSSQPSSLVSVALRPLPHNTYELASAWIGPYDSPPFPGEPEATPESKPYWLAHSLVWGSQEIKPGTETSVCPW